MNTFIKFVSKYKKDIILIVSTVFITSVVYFGLAPKDTSTIASTETETSTTLSKPVNDLPNLPALYVGSKNSDKYHKSDCKWAKKIKSSNKITFKSSAIAISNGYSPCKTCID